MDSEKATLSLTVWHLIFLDRDPDRVKLPVLDEDFKPLFSVNVIFPKSGDTVNLGNKIKPEAVSSPPDLFVHAVRNHFSDPTPTIGGNVSYTFSLTDPDATSRSDPAMAEMCHWLVTGLTLDEGSKDHMVRLPGSTDSIADAFQARDSKLQGAGHNSNVKELMPYYAPAPPPKTGYHRYVFVLLASNSDDDEPKKPKERPHWGYGTVGKGVRDWAKDNGLTPVGANFFYAENKEQ
ncbi:MAG: hypothetical protein LQ345_001365 [Seirophora villosa]|nr:MAG: hypothetical protein LQ345_001365 [Seirophora villosa]